tara:strand:- start:8858 stop:9085 length:228 start_codon:yes stop_codon:yes gene_type:complete
MHKVISSVKKLQMDTEDMLVDLLNEKGMTNEQAIKNINEQLGSYASKLAEEILQKWNENDLPIGLSVTPFNKSIT